MQAAAEIAIGTGEVTGGTVLDLTGVGAIVGVPTQVIGVATIAHGTFTGANTINNINNDPILNKDASQTNGSGQTPTQAPATASPQVAPTGKLEIEPGRTLSPQEQFIADKLIAEGKTVKAPKEIENKAGVRNADFEIDGVKTDLKNVSNIKKRLTRTD